MRKIQFATDFSVGFVLFVATVVVISSLFLVGDGSSFFADHVEFKVAIPSAGGLKTSSKVELGGVLVGSVKRIEFSSDLSNTDIIVTIEVDKSAGPRIRGGSVAWLATQGLLGDTTIQISPGSSLEPPLVPGTRIEFSDRPLLDGIAGKEIRESTSEILSRLLEVLRDVNRGEGTIGRLLKDPELYKNLNQFTAAMASATKEVDSIATDLREMLAEVKGQKGTLGKLIFSPKYAEDFSTTLQEAGAILTALRKVSELVQSGEGSLGRLVHDTAAHDALVSSLKSLDSTARRVDAILERAEERESLLGRILLDAELGKDAQQVVRELKSGTGTLDRILAKVDRGEGSVGMLVNDPSIAASLRDIFLGVSDSGLMTNVVRDTERAGREAYLRSVDLRAAEREEILRARVLARLPDRPSGGSTSPAPGDGGEAEAKPVPASGPEKQP